LILNILRENTELGQAFRIFILGALAIFVLLVSYTLVVSRFPSLTFLENFAYANLLLTVIGLVGVAYGLLQILRVEASRLRIRGELPSSTFSTIAYLSLEKGFARVSNLSALAYSLFFAFVSGTIVYQPWLRFSEVYGANIPSALIAVCCGAPGEFPRLILYLTEHVGLLIPPLNLILLFTISWLVGINMSLTLFAYKNRSQGVASGWLGSFGAITGLLTGCPSCAGLALTTILGGMGAVSIATALASLQPVFIAASIPVLLVTPILTSKGLSKTFTVGCSPNSSTISGGR